MERPKLPNERTLEELLKSLEENVQEDLFDSSDDLITFLARFDIVPGEHIISVKLLYEVYSRWSKAPMKKTEFSSRINKYLPDKIYSDNRYLLINLTMFQLSDASYKLLIKNKKNATKIPRMKEHFEKFLSDNHIKRGNIWLENHILYYMYDKWTYKNRKKHSLGPYQFDAVCRLYFEERNRMTHKRHWYKVDESIFKSITKQQVREMRENLKQLYAKSKKKKTIKKI